MIGRIGVFVYGVVAYLIGAGAYFIGLSGFLGNFLGPLSIDQGPVTPFGLALLINIGLIVLFGLPHSLMARRSFKRWWTKIIPPAAERSTFMLQSGLLVLLLIWQWRPLPGVIWQVESGLAQTLIWVVFWCGWLIALIATFLINHFELTGLQQVYAHLRGRSAQSPAFRTPFLYKVVRHPMQFGVLLAVWATPRLTVGHLVFALGMTIYILIGLYFEERDLVRYFGQEYEAYRAATPQLIPRPWPLRRSCQRRSRGDRIRHPGSSMAARDNAGVPGSRTSVE
jgi:methanethiol S-methyltransferase